MILGPLKYPIRRVLGFQRETIWREDHNEDNVTGGSMRDKPSHLPVEVGGGEQWRTPPYARRHGKD
mgnify:FL=1